MSNSSESCTLTQQTVTFGSDERLLGRRGGWRPELRDVALSSLAYSAMQQRPSHRDGVEQTGERYMADLLDCIRNFYDACWGHASQLAGQDCLREEGRGHRNDLRCSFLAIPHLSQESLACELDARHELIHALGSGLDGASAVAQQGDPGITTQLDTQQFQRSRPNRRTSGAWSTAWRKVGRVVAVIAPSRTKESCEFMSSAIVGAIARYRACGHTNVERVATPM